MDALKVAMIGDWSSVVGFKAVGIEAHIISSLEDVPALWEGFPKERYAVVMMTELVYEVLRRRIPGFPSQEGPPVILPIPAVTGSLGIGMAVIRGRVVKALGSVIEG